MFSPCQWVAVSLESRSEQAGVTVPVALACVCVGAERLSPSAPSWPAHRPGGPEGHSSL